MRTSFVSETLVIAGSYLCKAHSLGLGIPLICLGCAGGLTDFLYFVSVKQNSENRKTQVYDNVKTFFSNAGKAIHEACIISGIENEKNKNKTIH
jgi:hypothetical protein